MTFLIWTIFWTLTVKTLQFHQSYAVVYLL